MRIFFTGATGVIGRRALPLLLAEGHSVTAAIHDANARERVIQLGAIPLVVDLFDREGLGRAMAGHDTVINMATHIPRMDWKMLFRRTWRENDRLRSTGVRNLVDAAMACGVQRFIQESFAPAYPDRGDDWIDETTPFEPDRYVRSVCDAESALADFGRSGTGVVLRFAGFYGFDATQTQIMIAAVRRGWAALPGSPQAFISSISHDDAAAAVVAALRAPGGTYNVADDQPLRRSEFFATLAAALHVAPPRALPAWSSRLLGSLGRTLARSERISNRKLREATGWRPRYPSVRDGWPHVLARLDEARTSHSGLSPRGSGRRGRGTPQHPAESH